ncbi:cobalt-precorrin 5A hydrolase [Isachenkonia alkalipeptolytica]|uniref:Cobalamin biosynthesis protein CbiG n=1 Tax=Isachenkonia alkalipeptolytica TaxID=2565777 RepID=A0AA44BC71_9CLOT|nr:cobalt-precorrin 5A hydrolase [Isachenkonia alkalipeptolytica]NBG87089.1 hypothetical protein [Isachenkonia alkalipeptolytica]
MSWGIITLTQNSLHLGLRVKDSLKDNGTLYAPEKIINSYRNEIIESIDQPFKSFVKSIYQKHQGMIFIMAAGIVVRSLEGLLEHKSKDPGVIVMDEKGEFIIPILSGHLGGANEMAIVLAEKLKATPVITTASDVQGKMAVDMLAKKLGFAFVDFNAATKLSGKIVNDEKVVVFTEVPLPDWVEKYFPVLRCSKEQLPDKVQEHSGGAIIVSSRNLGKELGSKPVRKHKSERESKKDNGQESEQAGEEGNEQGSKQAWEHKFNSAYRIQLYPKNLILGIGARKNVSASHVRRSIEAVLKDFGYSALSIKHFATVDVKEKEPGILEGIKEFNRPLKIISREEIKTVEGSFEGSNFVKETLGILAVAEPAAYLSSTKDGEFIFGKRKIEGLTLALWKENCH